MTVNFDYGTGPHQLAASITEMWENWQSRRQIAIERWKEVTEYIYATDTKTTSNKKNDWSHSTHIPKLTQIFDNLGANYASALFSNSKWFRWQGATADAVTKKKRTAIEQYLETKHLNNGILVEFRKLLDDWVQYGNCFAAVQYVRESHIDPDTNEVVRGFEGPKVMRISPYDIVFDPTVSDFANSPKIIRELVHKGDLIQQIEEMPDLQYDGEVLEMLLQRRSHLGGLDEADFNKEHQNRFDGFETSGEYYRSENIELLHFYGDIWDTYSGELMKNVCITIADKHFVLRAIPQKTWTGKPHVYHCGWRLRPDNLWAMGPLDNLVGMQYLMDHLENARADAMDQMLAPDLVFIGNVQEQQNGPQTRFYIDDPNGSVTQLAPHQIVLQFDNQIAIKEAQMEAYAGAPREAMGIRTPGEKTAFEVQSLLSAAGRLFQHKIEYFDQNFVEKILNAELEVARRNLNTVDVAEVMDDDLGVIEFLEIKKEDITAAGKLVPIGSRHFARQALLAQQLQQFEQVLLNDQAMAVHFPADKRAQMFNEFLGFDRFGLYEKFGQIAEDMERQQLMMTAEEQVAARPDMLELQEAAGG